MAISNVNEDSITALHPDIIGTHILNRLDGPTLASAACSSTQLHQLCTQDIFWREICNSTWPSINDPLVQDIISTFPSGHRSFFSDSFPTLLLHHHHHRKNHNTPSPTSQLVSAIDIKFHNTVIYSKVQVSETLADSFLDSPLWIDLLQPKETVATPIMSLESDDDTLFSNLQTNMSLSWIVIDPTTKRAANVSSLRPVSVRRHWVTGDIRLHYATIMAASHHHEELVNCKIGVTCELRKGGELIIKEVNLHVVGMDGKWLSGNRSLNILQEALWCGQRKKEIRDEDKHIYEKYLQTKRERRGRLNTRQRRLDAAYKIIRAIIFMTLFLLLLGRLFF